MVDTFAERVAGVKITGTGCVYTVRNEWEVFVVFVV